MNNILMPITNVINSLYAKDCSRKTKAAHRARAQAGKFLGSHAPFGYLKDPGVQIEQHQREVFADVVHVEILLQLLFLKIL